MPYLNIRQFAATKAETPGGGPAAPSTRRELWEILKIGKKAEVGLEGRAGTKNHVAAVQYRVRTTGSAFRWKYQNPLKKSKALSDSCGGGDKGRRDSSLAFRKLAAPASVSHWGGLLWPPRWSLLAYWLLGDAP